MSSTLSSSSSSSFTAGLEADLGEEGQPNCQQVLEPVHQQPRGIDGEDGSAPHGRSSVTAASALGARGSSKGTARTALSPRRPQMRSDSSANWFELNKLLSIEK